MTDTTHLVALQTRLSNERGYLAKAKKQSEIDLRKVWIKQIEKEIESEIAFLAKQGYVVPEQTTNDISDDELLAELLN